MVKKRPKVSREEMSLGSARNEHGHASLLIPKRSTFSQVPSPQMTAQSASVTMPSISWLLAGSAQESDGRENAHETILSEWLHDGAPDDTRIYAHTIYGPLPRHHSYIRLPSPLRHE